MYFVSFFLCLSSFVSLSVFLFCFLVASFDGLQPLLVISHCSLCSSVKKTSFVRSFVRLFSGDCQQVLLRLVFILVTVIVIVTVDTFNINITFS